MKLYFLFLVIFLMLCSNDGTGQGRTPVSAILQEVPAPNDSLRQITMQQIFKLGEPGIYSLALMSQTGNVRVLYALSSYAAYVTQALQDSARKVAEKAYSKALKQVTSIPAKAFLIEQLQLFGNDYAAAAISPYLIQEKLCDPAARAMVAIGGPVAKPALVYALSKAKGNCRISLVTALGKLRYLSGLDAITAFTTAKDLGLRRAALMAIAEIGNVSSDSLLDAAAAKVGYGYDSTNATAAYILFAQRLAENWPQDPARAIAAKLLKICTAPSQLPVRIAALQILVSVRDKDANRILGDAAADPSPGFREAALKLAAKNMNAANTNYWLERITREKGAVKAGILLLLGGSQQRATTHVIQDALEEPDMVVKQAAIRAAGMLGNTTMIASLLETMAQSDSTTIFLIRDVLLTIRSRMVISTASISLMNKPPLMQIALLQILAEKRAEETKPRIQPLLQSDNPRVREAAAATLKVLEAS